MEKNKRLIFIIVGLISCFLLLMFEILFPDTTNAWHTINLYLYGCGMIMFSIFLFYTLKKKDK